MVQYYGREDEWSNRFQQKAWHDQTVKEGIGI